jgi:hypothetical protein
MVISLTFHWHFMGHFMAEFSQISGFWMHRCDQKFGSWADLRDGAPHDETKNHLVVWGYIIIIRYATGSIFFNTPRWIDVLTIFELFCVFVP